MKSFKTYTEDIDQLLDSNDDEIDQELLQEISLRTVSIGVFLAKAKQYANKIDGEVRRLVAESARRLVAESVHKFLTREDNSSEVLMRSFSNPIDDLMVS